VEYRAKLTREGANWLIEFAGCPGCQTFGNSKAEALRMGQEALEGWIEAHLSAGQVPPRPKGKRGTLVDINSTLAMVLQLRWARADQGLSQTDVAKRARVSQQAIAKLENPDGNPTLGAIQKVAAALGLKLDDGRQLH
jgi:predicted RNase H-like HicB family nuclease/DNA-binding XRE family transcriptional regulator